MAKALECPACGAKHRLDGLDLTETFRCDRCGQKLKIPASVAMVAPATEGDTSASTPPPGTGTATAPASTSVAPPRRRGGGTATTAVIGASTAAPPKDRDVATGDGRPPRGKSRTARSAPTARRRVKWYWRVVAWIVAIPLGFMLTAWPAYEFGLIGKDDVLDVFVGSGTDRYTRLAIVTLLWALVTAILVQLFIEGGRVWADRRRRSREASSGVASPRRGARATG